MIAEFLTRQEKIWVRLNYGWKEIRFWHEWNLCCKSDKTCLFILQKFQPILKSKAIFLNCVSLVNFLLPFILNIFDVPFNKQQTIEWLKTEWTLDFIHNFIFIVLFQQYHTEKSENIILYRISEITKYLFIFHFMDRIQIVIKLEYLFQMIK